MTWQGTMHVTTSGTYHFGIWGNDAYAFRLNGGSIVNQWWGGGEEDIYLTSGDYDVAVGLHEGGGAQNVHFEVRNGVNVGDWNSVAWTFVGNPNSIGLTITTQGIVPLTNYGNDINLVGPGTVALTGSAIMGKLIATTNDTGALAVTSEGLGNSYANNLTFTETDYSNNLAISPASGVVVDHGQDRPFRRRGCQDHPENGRRRPRPRL